MLILDLWDSLDILQSISFGSRLVFIDTSVHPEPESLQDDPTLVLKHLADFVHSESTSTGMRSERVCQLILSESCQVLSDTKLYLSEASHKGCVNDILADRLFHKLENFNRHGFDTCDTGNCHVARACHQTIAILYNSLANRHGLAHESNEGYSDGLLRALKAGKRHVWDGLPYLKLWM